MSTHYFFFYEGATSLEPVFYDDNAGRAIGWVHGRKGVRIFSSHGRHICSVLLSTLDTSGAAIIKLLEVFAELIDMFRPGYDSGKGGGGKKQKPLHRKNTIAYLATRSRDALLHAVRWIRLTGCTQGTQYIVRLCIVVR